MEIRAAERGGKRRILELAERNARLALDQEKLKAERRRQQRVDALDGLQAALGLDALPVRIECFDISNLGGTHTVASMVVFEGGAPKKADYRRFTIRTVEGIGRFRLDGRGAQRGATRSGSSRRRSSPHDADRDASFAALPNLIVIDGGQGPALGGPRPPCRASASAASRSSRWPSASRRSSCPGVREPLRLPHDTPELQLLQRVRDEAHRFAITHHRIRRDRAMTESIMDDLPGVGPARKRALLQHFGSPEAVLGASREQLEAVPGVPAKVGPRALRPPQQDRPVSTRLHDLVVVSGFSGAGKSSAMNVFEDAGYFCVDNLPAEMIRSLAGLFIHEGSKVERAGVVSDLRGGGVLRAARGGARRARRGGRAHTACCSSRPTSRRC